MHGSQGEGPDGAWTRRGPISRQLQAHAAVVLAATRALVQVHDETVRGLREVEVLLGGTTPRAITTSITREAQAAASARRCVVALQELFDRDDRLEHQPRIDDRPGVDDLVYPSRARAPATHLMAVRRWNLSQRRQLWEETSGPASVLAETLRADGHDGTAVMVGEIWGRAASVW